MKKALQIILWIWQLPQNLLGLILRLFYKGDRYDFRGVTYIITRDFPGGLSLASTVFLNTYLPEVPQDWLHEYGHTRQSLYLGPLYLIVIGLPSLLWATYRKIAKKSGPDYYAFYTEKWADNIGKVNRA